jgi:hypothetical protein
MPQRSRVSACAAVALAAVLGGCTDPAVGVRLVFPSELTFLATANARVDVYDGSEQGERSPDAICRALAVTPPTPPAGVSPLTTSGTQDACLFRAGGVELNRVGVGRRVFFVEAQDFAGQSILRGCTVRDLSTEAAVLEGDDAGAASDLGVGALVDVQLATLPEFPPTTPSCASVAEKCDEGVSCNE